MNTPPRNSSRMSQPWFMQGQDHRRESVVVDGDGAWALFCASADGNVSEAQRLISENPDRIHAQIWYAKPIDVALREGHTEIVRAMHEADDKRYLAFHIRDWCYRTTKEEIRRRGFTKLLEYLADYESGLVPHYSADLDPLKKLLTGEKASWEAEKAANNRVISAVKGNADLLRATDNRGLTLLHLAVREQNFVLLNSLLELGASLESETVERASVMDYAVEHFPAAIAFLLQQGANPTLQAHIVRGMTADIRQMLKDDPGIVNQLGPFGKTPLSLATSHRQRRTVELLLEYGADPNHPSPNAEHGDALFIATTNWSHSIMKLLLEAGANPNANIDSTGCCLSTLVDHRKWGNHPAREAYDLLVDYGAVDPPEDELEFLQTQPLEVVDHGYISQWMNSAEHADVWAERFGTHRIETLWYELGNASRPNREAMETMIGHGLNINRTDWWGRTQLHAEAAYGDVERAEMLLDLGADLHVIDVHARTNAIGYAARGGHADMVDFLLEQGAEADPDVPDWGKPLALAQYYLDHHEERYEEEASTALQFTGHRTDQPKEEYERVIQLLNGG